MLFVNKFLDSNVPVTKLRPTSTNFYCPVNIFIRTGVLEVGRDSSVGIATHFGMDGPGIEFR